MHILPYVNNKSITIQIQQLVAKQLHCVVQFSASLFQRLTALLAKAKANANTIDNVNGNVSGCAVSSDDN